MSERSSVGRLEVDGRRVALMAPLSPKRADKVCRESEDWSGLSEANGLLGLGASMQISRIWRLACSQTSEHCLVSNIS